MIILQEELAQEFRKEVLESFCLLDINFPVPQYLTETDNQVIHDEKIYVSRGFSFDNINSAPGLSVAEIDLLIDNTDKVLSSILLNGDQRGREVKISLGAAIGGPGAVADGSVKTATRANTKISAVDGFAFVDFSESAFLTLPEHRGCKLTVTSISTGKKLTGYIKAAGTGETLGSELNTNADFSAWTGDNPDGWAMTENASNYVTENAGLGARFVSDGSGFATVAQTISGAGSLHKLSVTVSARASGALRYQQNPGEVGQYANFDAVGNSTFYRSYTGTSHLITRNSACDVTLSLFSAKQVLTPAVTGVTITSTADGSTFNWASKEAGFNYNDASGYTYQLERERSLLVQEFIRGFISSWELSSDNQVRISVKNEAMLWAKKTLRIHSSSCPWVFKGTECGYTGTATWCDRNYARCGELLNTDNYGGFRFLPSIMEREIWWGRQRR